MKLMQPTIAIFLVCLGFCWSVDLDANSTSGPTPTTVCQLFAAPGTTAIRVRVSAVAIRGPRHGSYLVDSNCRGERIGFRFSDKLPPSSVAQKFMNALMADPRNLAMRIFTVQVSGTFDPKAGDDQHGLILIDHVTSFEKQAKWPRAWVPKMGYRSILDQPVIGSKRSGNPDGDNKWV
ncbi:hypothetical protein [Luteibacter rhizovicinus]|uniref:hypothetical protein n=1 Tax=Luteibacter rhizovicinus TaxID=242606 RepID=UPI00104AD722|nr:hypothetical protein [Luteibacter rhizovicinus]